MSGSAHACFRALAKAAGGDGDIRRLSSDGCPAMALPSLLLFLLHAQALSILIDAADASESLWADDGRPPCRCQALVLAT